MARKRSSSGPAWQAILEDIRSQNRTTVEAIEAFRASIEERIERLDRESRQRDDTLALAIGELRREVRRNSADIVELRQLGVEDRNGIAELTRLGMEDRADIAELRHLAQEHGADIAELKQLGLQNSVEIRDLKVDVRENTVELRALSAKVDALNRLDERVSALERHAQ
jgi:hypothetical protein